MYVENKLLDDNDITPSAIYMDLKTDFVERTR